MHCTGHDLSRFSAVKTMQYATDIELHVHTYAVSVADITACEGSPHNVLHSSSLFTDHVPHDSNTHSLFVVLHTGYRET